MDKEQLIKFLKENLTIEVDEHIEQFTGEGLKVSLNLNGEKISSDSIILKANN
ncbi:hypothetical protein MOC41_06210 [Bacillus spizizenii]|nr:hypothetical protein [Bacillus spizizenii]MCY7990008.1 hypothetical protein [Bacillus spizizenii]MCY7996686.1 hypothetical protein [Bacillus spizizenii]MCY8051350.1 hypothetical protein [Bacillus spizizenii]MCY8300206.1 hypothetical protein [Bacillus spizizenii]